MDGVLLAGGLASRLGPITKVINKHLLPIYNKPMLFYGIELLRDLGCERVIIILGGNSVGDIVNLVRDGSQFGVEIVYKYQNEPKGISHAIYQARDIIDPDDGFNRQFLVLLGDNVFANTQNLKEQITDWTYGEGTYGVFLTSSDHPHDYGQPILINEGMEVEAFTEKNVAVDHSLIVTGLYALETSIFNIIERQKPSERGEFEITDSLSDHLPLVDVFHYDGFWSDCGTPEGLAEATQYFMKGDSNVINGTGREESASELSGVSLPS